MKRSLAENADNRIIQRLFRKAEMTVKDWLEIWMTEFSFDKRYSTLKGYRAQINKHILPAIEKAKGRFP